MIWGVWKKGRPGTRYGGGRVDQELGRVEEG